MFIQLNCCLVKFCFTKLLEILFEITECQMPFILLAKSFYPQDFVQDDFLSLELECAYYKKYMT